MKDPAQRSDSEAEIAGSPSQPGSFHYAVQVLGSFAIYRDGVPLDTTGWQRRSLTLLKLLATSPDRRRLRDELIDLLWPDADPEAGSRNLRYVLHILRRDLGGGEPSPIESHRDWIALSSEHNWEIDLQEAEELIAQADGDVEALQRIVDLHRGEALLEDRYEDWALPVRERAMQSRRTALLRLARRYRENGDWDSATRTAEQVLREDDFDEEALRELLRSLEASDRSAEAVRRFQDFARRLDEEIGVSPSQETLAIVERMRSPEARQTEAPLDSRIADLIRAAKRPEPPGGYLGAVPTSPIVAREDEIERVAVAAEAVQAGAGRLLVLVGEAGVGKTRLAQEAALRLRQAGFLVLTGRCYDTDEGPMVHPFLEILSQACASMDDVEFVEAVQSRPHLKQFLSAQLAPPDAEDRLQLTPEVTTLLTNMSVARPVAILIDDLQWTEEATLGLLQHIVRHTRNLPMLLLLAYRETEVDREQPLRRNMRSLDREGLVERVALRRLTEEGTAALVATTISEIENAEEFVEFVHRRTKGNPFYIHKMVQALGGHYRLIRQIGAGGMGRVFEAIDTRSGEPVAAKIMFARTEADPRALQRFEQEGAMLAALTHPNIVEVHGTFLEERANCIVMELLEGQSMGELLRSSHLAGVDRFPLSHLKVVTRQVTAALKCAHDRSIIHRDIKPDNIMVLPGGQVKVTDFGIARMMRPIDAVSTVTSTGMTMGTPLYMAPEQIEGKQVDGRADIYSLGAVLYEAVTGRPPFEADDPLSVAISHVREEPKPPGEVNPELPEDWNDLILKMLSKDPRDRVQSAGALGRLIEGLTEETGSAERSELGARGGLQRTGWIAAAAGALLLGLLAIRLWLNASSGTSAATLGPLQASWTLPSSSPAVLKKPTGLASDGRGGFFAVDTGTDRVRHLSSTGSLLNSWGSLGSAPGQLRDPQALAIDSTGNVYVADSGNDRIEKFSGTGRLLHVWGSSGSGAAQFRFPDGIAVDRSGFMYISDWGNNRIVVLRPSGQPKATSVGTFTSLYPGLNRPAGLGIDRKGQLFVLSTGDHQVVKFSPDGIIQLGAWPTAANASGLALNHAGQVFVTDASFSEVQSFSSLGKLLRTWSGPQGAAGRLKSPQGITIDQAGATYVADSGNGRIFKLSASGRWLAAFNSSGSQPPSPDSVSIDRNGDVFVSDSANNRILELSASGRWLQSKKVSTTHSGASGGVAQPRFIGPIGGMAVAPRGDALFATDYGSGRVLKLDSSFKVVATWGSNGSGPALINPQGIAASESGVYVVDQGNGRVQVFSPAGSLKTLGRIATSGGAQPYLYGVAVDQRGFVYLTDDLHDRIIKLSPQLHLVSQWGSRGSASGRLRAPQGITVDSPRGILYVADTGNNRIQLFSLTGKPLGSSSTSMIRPAAVSVDERGTVYVADTGRHRVEKFSPR